MHENPLGITLMNVDGRVGMNEYFNDGGFCGTSEDMNIRKLDNILPFLV